MPCISRSLMPGFMAFITSNCPMHEICTARFTIFNSSGVLMPRKSSIIGSKPVISKLFLVGSTASVIPFLSG